MSSNADKSDVALNEAAKRVRDLFIERKLTLATAESFTGGAVAAALVRYSGTSAFFKDGVVCYSADAKIARLNVKRETIEKFSVVSEQVATEMVKGLLNSEIKPDYAIATTGNADVTSEKNSESGVAYIAAGSKENIIVEKLKFTFDRAENIAYGAASALDALYNLVKNQKR